jgi:hypothetical protein
MHKYHILKTQLMICFYLDNDIDGSILMSDEFDQSIIKELIPTLEDGVLFNITRNLLKENYEKVSYEKYLGY